jgi:hypothetical protein
VVPFNIACGRCFMCDRDLQSQCETTQVRAHGKGAALFGYTELYEQVPYGPMGMPGTGSDPCLDPRQCVGVACQSSCALSRPTCSCRRASKATWRSRSAARSPERKRRGAGAYAGGVFHPFASEVHAG